MAKKRGVNDAELIEKERKVLEMRLLGLSWDAIAANVGYASRGAAWNAYQRALTRTLQEPAAEVRQQELERLNRIMSAHIRNAMNGDVAATNTVLRIMDMRAKLLGLFAPTKLEAEVTSYQGGGDIDREVARLAALLEQSSGGSPVLDETESTL